MGTQIQFIMHLPTGQIKEQPARFGRSDHFFGQSKGQTLRLLQLISILSCEDSHFSQRAQLLS